MQHAVVRARRWVVDNEKDMLVVAVYQRTLNLPHVGELLQKAGAAFRYCCAPSWTSAAA